MLMQKDTAKTTRNTLGMDNKSLHLPVGVNLAALLLIAQCFTSTSYAALKLANTPLYTTSSSIPNILFVVDDSSSMHYEILTQDLANDGAFANDSDAIEATADTYAAVTYPDGTTSNTTTHNTYDLTRQDLVSGGNIVFPTQDCTFDLGFFEVIGDTSKNGYVAYTAIKNLPRGSTGTDTWDDIYFGVNAEPSGTTVSTTQYRCNFVAEQEWRVRDYRYNSLYYNPNKKYERWYGQDSSGTDFNDLTIDITTVPLHPYQDIGTINLEEDSALITDYATGVRKSYDSDQWKQWCHDTLGFNNNDVKHNVGHVSRTKCYGWRYYDETSTLDSPRWVRDMSDSQKENFINWFVYHRTREYAAKYALSKVIESSTRANLGYSALTQNDNAVAVGTVDSESEKLTLLNKIFSTSPKGATPLRSALSSAGEYFNYGTAIGSGIPATGTSLADSNCQINTSILVTDGIYDTDDAGLGNKSLADIASHYYNLDLGSTKKSPHMRTHAISFGPQGSLDPKTTDPASVTWPDPFDDTDLIAQGKAKIDDLWHAAYISNGSFYNADDSLKLANALKEAINTSTDPQGSAIQVAFSNYRLDNSSLAYSSTFSPGDWTGTLSARLIDANGTVNTAVAWEAGARLDSLSNPDAIRNIITYDGIGSTKGVPFNHSLSDKVKQTMLGLGTTPLTAANTTEANNLINFIRGNDSNPIYRTRTSLLGDIVNSSPIYVGAPGFFYPDQGLYGENTKRYSDFWKANKDRAAVLYVGANDGMLHAFNAASGDEVFAYIPESVHGTLKNLSLATYKSNHRYYVDATPTVADAYFGPRGGARDWHTVVTGGLGAGGQGWYALNTTDPTKLTQPYADSIALWEFNQGDDVSDTDTSDDIGYSLSKPIIAMTNTGTNKRWAMITGNGYSSASGLAKLFIVFLDAAPSADGAWTANSDYVEISTSSDIDNGLSSPNAVDLDGNGTIDRVYAGDLKGNMWAFDLSSADVTEWAVADGINVGTSPDTITKDPLFTAQTPGATPQAQPITVKPAIIRNTKANGSPNLMIYFGTGQYMDLNDIAATADDPDQKQSFYAIWDSGKNKLTRSNLQEQTFTNYDGASTSEALTTDRTLVDARATDEAVEVNYNGNLDQHGWRLDLEPSSITNATAQERVVTDARVQYGVVFFSTFTPSTDGCSAGGSTWFMFLDAFDGGLPKTPVIDLNNDYVIDANDLVTSADGGSPFTPGGLRVDGSAAPLAFASKVIAIQSIDPDINDNTIQTYTILGTDGDKNRRVSWRELRRP